MNEETEKDKGGRPPYQPTKVARRKVAVAAGSGMMTHEEIAIGLGISTPTLRKYFAHELAQGAYEKKLEVIQALHRAAVKGNVAAQKAYAAMTPKVAAPPADPEKPEKEPQLGKKDQANADAKTAQVGTDWEDLLRGAPPASVQ